MNATPFVQKPKIELEAEEGEEQEREGPEEEQRMKEQEEALLALVQHRTKEVDHIRQRITYYPSIYHVIEARGVTVLCHLFPEEDAHHGILELDEKPCLSIPNGRHGHATNRIRILQLCGGIVILVTEGVS